MLTAPAAYDYSIQSGSPAIDVSMTPAGVPGSVLSAHAIQYQPRMRGNGLSHVRPATCWEFFRNILSFRFSRHNVREIREVQLRMEGM